MNPTARYPRRFVPADLAPADWDAVSRCFDALERDLNAPGADLEHWLASASEFASVLAEEKERRFVAMTCRTDDPETVRRFEEFVQGIEPKLKPRWHALHSGYLRHAKRSGLDPGRWRIHDRAVENEVSLFRPENVALEAEEEGLMQEYNKIAGAQTVRFRGEEQTLVRMESRLEEQDRALRQEAWEAIWARRLQDREALDALYDKLIALRGRLAANAGQTDYRAYIFRKRERFDYGPEHCFQFHQGVERAVMPRLRALDAERKRRLGVDPLRPWDLGVDPRNAPPLRPFATAEELYRGCREMFRRVHPEFAELAEEIRLDLDNRKGKAPGGYQTSFEEERRPFIFMNATGTNRDVITMLHEGGHAFHYLLTREEPVLRYRYAPIEFCEVASMGMELLALPHYEVFYGAEEARRARVRQLERTIRVLPMVATIDAFQHWIYLNPGGGRDARTAAWRGLSRRFAGGEDWSGYETQFAAGWQRILHLYTHPFYFIEYGIAQIGALQIWSRARRDPAGAVAAYRRALALGGTRPLPELFRAADLVFDFSEATLAPLAEEIGGELAKLDS